MPETLRRAVERHPLLWIAGMAAAAVVAGDGHFRAGGVGFAVLAGLVFLSGKWRLALGGVAVAAAAGWMHHSEVARRADLVSRMGCQQSGPIEARLLENPRAFTNGWAAVAEVVGSRDRVWLVGHGRPAPAGSVVAGLGRYQPVPAPRNPGQFDMRPWLDRRGVFAVFRSDGVLQVRSNPPYWMSAGEGIRSAFRESVVRGLDPVSREASVIRAVVLGDHPDDDVLIEPFRRSGTLHVFAVSGLHVGMVGLLGWLAMRACGLSRRGAVIPLALMMFAYAWLTGMKPPAVRAAWMAAVVLGAFWFRRRPDVGNALGLAALLVLLRDGDLLFQAGVQLSFGVVLAIGLLHHGVGRAFGWMTRVEPYLPRSLYGPWRERWLGFRRRVADMLAVSGSAWLGSAPLTAAYFGIATPVSVIASVVLFAAVFPLLGLALLSALLSPLPRVSEAINGANAFFARSALTIAHSAAAVPGGNFAVPRGRPGSEFMVVYDLGADGATVWRSDAGCLLVDGGSARTFDKVVLPSMRTLALRPERFVLTHPDGGHAGGLAQAVDAFPIREGLVPVIRAKSSNFRDLLRSCGERDVRLLRGRTGVKYDFGSNSSLEVLLEPDARDQNLVADERVMPVRCDWRGWRILFMSDAGWATERSMMDGGSAPCADVIVAGRHLHDASLGSRFLEESGARVVIAGHSDFPMVQRVPESWRSYCEEAGIEVFHQGESGAVSLVIEDGSLVLRGYVDGREIRLEKER